MAKTRILVLGASGMLGSIVADYLSLDVSLEIIATMRNEEMVKKAKSLIPNVDWRVFHAGDEEETLKQLNAIGKVDWIINAIGIIKPYIHDDNPAEIERALFINSLFPHTLARFSASTGAKVLQIATDCVYSGAKGKYVETDPHDAIDVYGKTKSLGEVFLPGTHLLRVSIIGPEPKAYFSLLEWFLHQKPNAELNGFTNHKWNGITTLHFAKICGGIIKEKIELPRAQHIIPQDEIAKYDLLRVFKNYFKRTDVVIRPTEAGKVIDRTLATSNRDLNEQIWKAAGYLSMPPTIEDMVKELSEFNYRLKVL